MFRNVPMLAGLGAVALPLVLHLLARARYRTHDWGAMMFLDGRSPRHDRLLRLRSGGLLVVRMAAIAALALALARPVLAPPGYAPGPVTAVIIVDRSLSMACDEGGVTRLALARQKALQVLASFRPGDRASVLLAGDGVVPLEPQPTDDLRRLARHLADLDDCRGAADLPAAIRLAANILQQAPAGPRELYVVCDTQASSWNGADAALAAHLGDRPLRFLVLPVGSPRADNLAVQSVRLVDAPAIAGVPAEVEIHLRNYGALPRAEVPLTLSAGRPDDLRVLRTTTISMLPDSQLTLRLTVQLETAATGVLCASVAPSGVPGDDRAYAALEMIGPIRVQIVSGDERSEPLRGESDYLRMALMPYGARRGNPAVVTVVPAERWSADNLDEYDVVVLANVPQVTPAQARALEQYVYSGRGLIMAPGDLVRADNYNRVLYRDAAGVLPALLEGPVRSHGPREPIRLIDPTHPALAYAALDRQPSPARHFVLRPRWFDVGVLATCDGDKAHPWLVASTTGRGRVLLLAGPLDADWSDLPLSASYLPLVQSMVRWAATANHVPRNVSPGEPLLAQFAGDVDGRTVRLVLPGGRRLDASAVQLQQYVNEGGDLGLAARRTVLRFENARLSGVYQLTATVVRPGGARENVAVSFVVRPDPRESDLTPLDAVRWNELSRLLRFERLDGTARPIGQDIAWRRTGRELWLPLLLASLAFMLGEMIMTRAWCRTGTQDTGA